MKKEQELEEAKALNRLEKEQLRVLAMEEAIFAIIGEEEAKKGLTITLTKEEIRDAVRCGGNNV